MNNAAMNMGMQYMQNAFPKVGLLDTRGGGKEEKNDRE
jgi:hypothetical protein